MCLAMMKSALACLFNWFLSAFDQGFIQAPLGGTSPKVRNSSQKNKFSPGLIQQFATYITKSFQLLGAQTPWSGGLSLDIAAAGVSLNFSRPRSRWMISDSDRLPTGVLKWLCNNNWLTGLNVDNNISSSIAITYLLNASTLGMPLSCLPTLRAANFE